ncbi:MAG: adenylate/guanylate cyclase domain-containing protein [Anaerolineales bacterium]
MHRLIPPLILENYASGNLNGEFEAVGMFADMSGFSAMTDELMTHGQHGAEVLAVVLRKAFEPMIQSVYEHGGFIATQAGDAFTALFPVTTNPQETAQKALTAAIEIQNHIQAQSRPTTPYGEFSIAVKIGLTIGVAAWGILKSQDEKQAVCYFKGSAIDESAQAEHFAKREEIILSPSFYKTVQTVVRVENIENHFRLLDYTGKLTAPQAILLPAFDLDLASRFFPKDLFTQRFAGEFRQVVGLFIGMPEVEQVSELNRIMQSVFELQKRYSGLVKLYFGDKGPHILVIWGAPIAYENDVERALSFILDLKTRANTRLHAGVTYRIAHAGCIGSALSEEYATFGRGVNLAARFMTSAPAGEIWVDEFVARRAQVNFDLEYVEARNFKGFFQPQKVFTLLGRKPAREIEYIGKMVGRESEIRQLQEFIQPIFEGQFAGLMLVFGEPGMGKSRLVYEFLNAIPAKRASWFLAQTDQLLRESLNPFRYGLRHYFGIASQVGEKRNQRNFDSKLNELIATLSQPDLAETLERTRSCLGALFGLHWPGSLYEQLDAEARYQNTLIGLTALIQAESLRQPVILFIEDIQWLDDDSAAFVPGLLRALSANETIRYPIALIATSRYEHAKLPLDSLPHQKINLEQLNRQALAALTQAHLGGAVSASLLDVIESRAEGNPFFAEQILRYAQEEGLLSEQEGKWSFTQGEQLPALPIDVNALLIARLDQLVQEVKETVQAAAVLGREFEVHVLSRLLELQEIRPADLTSALNKAEREAIWAALSDIRYIFRHALMWDAAYHMQLHARRQALHAVVVESLENLYANDLSNHYGELAYHAERALLVEKARAYLFKAAEAAKSAYQNSLAEDYYTRALQLTPKDDLLGQYDLLLARLEIYKFQGRHEERQRDLNRLQELANALNDPGRILEVTYQQAEAIFERGEAQQAANLCQQGIEMALATQNTQVAIALYSLLGNSMQRLSQFEAARENIEKGLQLARSAGNLHMESNLLNAYGMAHILQGDLHQAEANFQHSLAIARQVGDLRLQARPLTNLGMVANYRNDYLAARKYFEQSLVLTRQIGARNGEAVILGNLGFIAANLGDYASARAYTETYLRIAREIGQKHLENIALINLSAQLGALGETEAAIDYAQNAFKIAQHIEDQSGQAWALTYLGHHRLTQKKYNEADEAYQAAIQHWRELNQPVLATESLAGRARLALAQGNPARAHQFVDEILSIIEQHGHLNGTDDPLRVYFTCYQVLAMTNEMRARSLLETAHTLLQARASQIPDETNRQKYLERSENRSILAAWQSN